MVLVFHAQGDVERTNGSSGLGDLLLEMQQGASVLRGSDELKIVVAVGVRVPIILAPWPWGAKTRRKSGSAVSACQDSAWGEAA